MAGRHNFALHKQRKLLKQARELAIEKGAVPTPDGFYQFQIDTTVGLLRLSFSEGDSLASVFGRFDDPERAIALIGRTNMNPYSGKWNHHWGKDDDPELVLLSFKADLDWLTAAESPPYLEDRKGETMTVEFLNGGAEAIYTPGNGHTIRYRLHDGIYFHEQTPVEVVRALNATRQTRTRIRIRLGDRETGRDWLEEHDVEGYVGNSMGPLKVPLLIHNRRSSGGPALLDHCIVKIIETRTGRVLYSHPSYHTGSFTIREIGPDEVCGHENLRERGYSHAVDVDGCNQANFRSLKAAEKHVCKMTA